MANAYQVIAFVLTVLLLPGFGHLYLRFRDARTLLWFLGFLFALVRMVLSYRLGFWDFSAGSSMWLQVASQTAILISTALFLASLSPATFRLGRVRILYVIPFGLPLVAFTFLLWGRWHGAAPQGGGMWVFILLALLSGSIGLVWGIKDAHTPSWLGGGVCGFAAVVALWTLVTHGPQWALTSAECSTRVVTAILVLFVFRRFSPGVSLTVVGFLAWSLTIVGVIPGICGNAPLMEFLGRVIVMGKVVAALGMILLVLEDQLSANKEAQHRERRARMEMEAYGRLALSRRRLEDFDRQADEICQAVVEHSRFSQATLLLLSDGRYRVAGSAGVNPAITRALDAAGARIPPGVFLAPDSAPPAVGRTQTVRFDLDPWLEPGDDLKRLRFTSTLAVPLAGRGVVEGALLLAGMRDPQIPLRAEDLLPVEMLTARLLFARSQTTMLEKLIDAEKFAGLGQLAANVTQQLNNPLTVILGYASLLEENRELSPQERRGVDAILTEARRMRMTLESLSRVAYTRSDHLTATSVGELLTDLEELHRSEFLQRSIEFRLNVSPALPLVLCNAQQLRQAVLHCLQFAMDAVDGASAPAPGTAGQGRSIRVEALAEGKHVQIHVAHTGRGFQHPDRAFDPFASAPRAGETAGLGLSFCATLLRDNNGRASAMNLEPQGAAIILELQAA